MDHQEQHKATIARFRECINTCDRSLAENDKAVVSWICSGTHDGDFMGRAPTGKTFSFSCMNFYYFNAEGRIIRDVAAQGLAGLFAALEA